MAGRSGIPIGLACGSGSLAEAVNTCVGHPRRDAVGEAGLWRSPRARRSGSRAAARPGRRARDVAAEADDDLGARPVEHRGRRRRRDADAAGRGEQRAAERGAAAAPAARARAGSRAPG